MKKQSIAIIYIFLLLIGAIASLYKEPIAAGSTQQPVVIPDEAIRLRILANSDSEADQALKRKVRDEVNAEITVWVEELTSIEEARQLIQSRLPEIEAIVQRVLEEEKVDQTFKVNFNNVNFPTKIYGNYIYPAGDYEAILITLGKGNGANWWCVLFPPLCFLDFSNSEAVQAQETEEKKTSAAKTNETLSSLITNEEEKEEKAEVKFFLVEWFTSLFA
ncbi:stage II sporulation protein R [Metabacillus arenae]|uniref:Stage II sporulation protein R n=1 Tax=Metabacillus arenae TaxID=2771434 RepID=A0A926NT47_9BACI|nr:stage II sporulation protein R [Metabacillus arenae]MBD1383457.1 stage II sporulation protein R [Metabacillus arenae]